MKKITFYLLTFFLGTVIFVSIIYLKNYSRIKNLEDFIFADIKEFTPEQYKKYHIDKEFLINQGWMPRGHHKSSYINFPLEKPSNIKIRIGLFGGSFIEGSETDTQMDISSILQKKISKYRNDIEFINFGVGSYGLVQSYFLWEYFYQKYELDYAIFLTPSFHDHRDVSFRYTSYTRAKSFNTPPHGLYFLDKNENLQLVKVKANSRKEAIMDYYGYFPPLKYILNDYYLVPLLQVFSIKGRPIRNPLLSYRYSHPSQRAHPLYQKLFNKVDEKMKAVFVFTNSDELINILDKETSIKTGKLNWDKYIHMNPSLYKTPCCHTNAFFYNHFANEVLSFLGISDKKPEHYLKLSLSNKISTTSSTQSFSFANLTLNKNILMSALIVKDKKAIFQKAPNLDDNQRRLSNYKSLYIIKHDDYKKIEAIPSYDFALEGKLYFIDAGEKRFIGLSKKISNNLSILHINNNIFEIDPYLRFISNLEKYPDIDIFINNKKIGSLIRGEDRSYPHTHHKLVNINKSILLFRSHLENGFDFEVENYPIKGAISLLLINTKNDGQGLFHLLDYSKKLF